MASEAVTASITAENTFSDPLQLVGPFNISISGTFAATVTVQRSTDNSTWRDVNTFTSPFEGTGNEPEVMYYRAGVKTGDFTSGTAVLRVAYDPQNRLS
jgi:hypothetical protein